MSLAAEARSASIKMTSGQTQRPRLVKRVRAYHTKTADGCKTCRIRRIKCDKEKPACKRCSRTGRICDGYASSPPGISESSCSSSPSCTEISSSSRLTLTITTNILEDDQERRSFSFFCRHTVPQLSGTFESDDFWKRLLLQASHHEPAILHAAVALGALHEKFEIIPNSNLNFKLCAQKNHDIFAMSQYSKAIKALLSSKEAGDGGGQAADVALVTCILFIYFEILRGHHGTAVSHIDGGIKILSSLPQTASAYVSKQKLTELFVRFDSQASALIGNRKRALLDLDLEGAGYGYVNKIPERFSGLEEARNALDYIPKQALRSTDEVRAIAQRGEMDKVDIMLACMTSAASMRLKNWDRAFKLLVERSEKEMGKNKEWRDAVNVMRMQRIFMSFYFCIDVKRAMKDESMWDEYTEEINLINELAEEIIGPQSEGDGRGGVKRVLCHSDEGIVLPLWFVATKCRVSSVRWKAIELMRRTERQEGLWNSVLTALVAERLIRLEEESMGGGEEVKTQEGIKIERGKRIRGAVATLHMEERRARVRFGRLKDENAEWRIDVMGDVEWIEEWVSW